MEPNTESLESAVVAAYERACQENDYEIAEYLLRALEVISQREGSEDNPHNFHLRRVSSLTRNQ